MLSKKLNYKPVHFSLTINIRSKVRTDNTSGVKGVKKQKNKWIAYITFKKRHYNLGTFENKEEAIKARRDAEEKFFKPILKKYNII